MIKNEYPKMKKVLNVENYNGFEIYINYLDSRSELQTHVAYENIENKEIAEKKARKLAERLNVKYQEYFGD